MSGYRNATYDDRHPSFVYQSYWFNGTWNASSTGESGTLATTNWPESNATFVFPEAARAFYYYGMRRSRGALFGICVDCDPNQRNYEEIDALNRTDDGKNPPSLLYSRHFETPGVHEIILRNLPDTRFDNNNSQLNIDRFVLELEAGDVWSSTAEFPSSSSTPSTSSPNSASTDGATNDGGGVSPGTIAGSVVGGVLGALFIILAILLCLRQRKRRKEKDSKYSLSPFMPETTQFYPQQQERPVTQADRRETDAGRIEHEEGDVLPPDYDQVFSFAATDAPSTREDPPPSPGLLPVKRGPGGRPPLSPIVTTSFSS